MVGEQVSSQPADVEQPRPPESRRKVRSIAALAVLALVATAVVAVQRQTPGSGTGSSSGTGLAGVIVYASSVDRSRSRIWVWNLVDGSVEKGPLVRHPLELVDASLAHPGWIGVTSALPREREEASVLLFQQPLVRAAPVRRGRLVAWSQGGQTVTVADQGAGVDCKQLSVWTHEFTLGTSDTRYRGPACGELFSLASSPSSAYVTLVRYGGATVSFVGLGTLHPVLEDHVLLSVSVADDLVVVPTSAVGPTPASTDAPKPGLRLFYRSPLHDPPIVVGVGDENFYPEKVLAWSGDGSHVYVLGTVGGHDRGIYAIEVGPGNDPHERKRQPTLIAATDADDVRAAVLGDGQLILVLDRQVYVARSDGLQQLSLPPEAGLIDGPLVWTASLRYSAS
jgi:hypothetical protein